MSIYQDSVIMIYCVTLAAFTGAVFGSFLNCAAMRIVRGEPFTHGRSHCPSCGHMLSPMELIPVISWVIQRGRCRSCGKPISIRYPLTELSFSLLTVLCLLRFDLTPAFLRNELFLGSLFLLTLTDLEGMIIPDGCHIFSAVVWAVFSPWVLGGWHEVGHSLLAAVIYGGGLLSISLVMDRILGRDSMGGGDIKLFAVIGLYLGMVGTLFALMFACVLGLLFNLLFQRLHRGDRAFPFGPSIAAAAAFMLLYGGPFVEWYLKLLR